MADLTASDVVINRSSNKTRSDSLIEFEKHCTITLSVHGDATAGQLIPAAAFGLSSLEQASSAVKSDDAEIIPAGISNDRSFLMLRAAGTAAPATTSGVYNIVVRGF